jgi:hypothetical protein
LSLSLCAMSLVILILQIAVRMKWNCVYKCDFFLLHFPLLSSNLSTVFWETAFLFYFYSFIYLFEDWGLNSGSTLSASPLIILFCDGFFWDRVSWTIYLDWLRTVILLISASWVARITDMNHWCLAIFIFIFLMMSFWTQSFALTR